MIASSHRRYLGIGDLGEGKQWALTYFAKTLFTLAGIDVHSRTRGGLSESVLASDVACQDGGPRRMGGIDGFEAGVGGFCWASTSNCHNKQKENMETSDQSTWKINSKNGSDCCWRKARELFQF